MNVSKITQMKCDNVDQSEKFANLFFFAMGTILAICCGYQYLKRHVRNDTNLHCLIPIYLILILMNYIAWTVSSAFKCVNADISRKFKISGIGIFIFQYEFLVWLLFYRLCIVFEESVFVMSKCTKTMWYVSYSSGTLLAGISVYVTTIEIGIAIWDLILITISLTILIVNIAYPVVLFVHKLMILSVHAKDNHNDETGHDEQLIFIATKAFVLTLACITALLLLAVALSSQLLIGYTMHYQFVVALFAAFVLGVNCISIVFGFQEFDEPYMKICGFCQTKCVKWFAKMAQERMGKIKNNSVVHIQSSSGTAGNQRRHDAKQQHNNVQLSGRV
eukprot:101276_1